MKGSEKINKVLTEIGLKPAQFARVVGLKSAQNIYDIQKDKVDISKDIALKIIEKYPYFNISWLLTGEGEMLKTSDHPPIEIEPVSGGEINVSQLMNMMQQQMVLVNNVVEQNRQLIDNNGKLVKVNETLAHTNKQLSHTNEKLMKELITLGKEERPAIDDFGSVEDRQ